MKNRQASASMLAARGRRCEGFLLLEVLVALLIFAFGVLGVVGLQAAMTKAQTSSKFRGEAAYLAQELIGTMWADIPNLAQYGKLGGGACSGHARCLAVEQKIAALLPGGSLTIVQSASAPGLFTITISWTPPSETTSQYVTSTAIRT